MPIDTSKMIYIGDGVYAKDDGFEVMLVAPRDGTDSWLVLEPQVLDALLRLVGKTRGGEFIFKKSK